MKDYKKLNIGDRIEIHFKDNKEKGILLESHEKGILLLKLDNGYNIGIKKEDILDIKILERDKKIIKEEDFKISGKKPIIDFIITGGTISSKLDPKTGGVKDLTNVNDFFKVYPEIFDIADIRVKSPFMKWSENMDSKDWIKLTKIIEKSLKDKNVKGVIVSHGTDFLHYTSSALSFMINPNKPVVLTYSQRSSDRGSSDARMNLKCSAYAALSDIAEVVLVGHASINDDYCYILKGNKVRKMHTSRRDAFKPINTKPIAKIWENGEIKFLSNYKKRSKDFKIDAIFNNNIALIKFYPGQNPDILDYYRKKGYKGLIIEMSGLGHIITQGKNNWLLKLKSLINQGIIICATPQTLYGRLDPYVYESGRKIKETGVIYLKDILPETAFVKLGWILGHKQWRGSIMTREKILENISGEFNDKLGNEFLD